MGGQRDQRAELHGRAGELAVIDDAVGAAVEGTGAVVLVEGEAGLGKSSLLRTARARAAEAGLQVLDGAAEELEQGRPFGLLVRALGASSRAGDERRRHLASLVTDALVDDSPSILAPGSSPRFLVQEAVLDLIEDLASDAPVALTLDDLQWADSPSLATVLAVVRRARELGVVLVAAYRPSPRPDELERVIDVASDLGAAQLALEPLAPSAVGELVRDLVGAPPGPRLRRQLEGAAGNPFYVSELVRALVDEGGVDLGDGCVEATGDSLPPTLGQSILRRLRNVSPGAADMLRAAAVIGRPFTVDELAVVMGVAPSDLHASVLEATRAGLLESRHDKLAVRHDLIRDAVYADMPPALRASLHRQVAAGLRSLGQPSTWVVAHVAAAADAGDLDAVRELRAAARELQVTDPGTAVDLLRTAAELDPATTAERAAADLVPLLAATGDLDGARQVAVDALTSADLDAEPVAVADLRLGLAEARLLAGDGPGAIEQLDLLAAHELDAPRRARWLADRAAARLAVYDLAGAEVDALAAVELGEATGDVDLVAAGLGTRSRLAAFDADFARAIELGQQAVIAAGSSRGAIRRMPHFYLGLALLNGDRADEAQVILAEGRRRAEAAGIPWAIASFGNALVMCALHTGQWDTAVTEAEATRSLHVDAATRAGYMQMEAMLAKIWFHRGEHDAARDALGRAEAEFRVPGHDPGGVVWLLWAQALFAEHAGDVGTAAELLGVAFDLAVQLRVHSVKLWYGPDLVRLALDVGQQQRAMAVALEVENAAERATSPTARAAALRCRGAVTGDPDVAIAACAAADGSPRLHDRAASREQAAQVLQRRGRVDDAVRLLHEALDGYDRLGAEHDRRRVAASLRELGVSIGAKGSRERPVTGIESLTPAERQVLDLVGEGLRNAEIADRLYISRRTVETHVGRLYQKLQVKGRVALAREAARVVRA